MTDERAMEILDPEHREHYESIEPVNEACRIGMNAIKRVKELEAENAVLKRALFIAAKDIERYKGYEEWDIAILAKEFYIPDVIKLAKAELKFKERQE